jgi:hypothetical protein
MVKRKARMPIKDILFALVGEPDPAAIAAIDKCVALAGNIGAKVTAMAVEEDILVRPKVTISGNLDDAAVIEWRDQDHHRTATLLGYDVALSARGTRRCRITGRIK